MSEEIDFSELNPALLDCQKHLNPADPQKFTAKATLKSLADAGLSKDGIMPNGLRAYIGAVLKVLDLQATNESLDKILRLPEVQITLKSAIEHAEKVYNSKDAVKEGTDSLLDKMNALDPESIQAIRPIVERSIEDDIKKEAADSVQNIAEEHIEEEELENEPEVEKKPAPHICPRCGWDTANEFCPVTYSEEDKKQFLYCLLGGTAFQKSFELFDGRMTIVFNSLTVDVENKLYDQMRYDLKEERFSDTASLNYAQLEYETVLALKEIKADGISLLPESLSQYEGPDQVRNYCKAVSDNYIKTSLRKRVINEAYIIFRKIYMELLNEVSSENFYKPA